MTPASSDPEAALRAVLAPLEDALAESRRFRAENAAFLEQKRRRRLTPAQRALLERAAQSDGAPESLRQLARRVEAGELTWDDVFTARSGELGREFREEAFRTAREQWADAEVERVAPPDDTVEGMDADEVLDAIDRDLGDAALRRLS